MGKNKIKRYQGIKQTYCELVMGKKGGVKPWKPTRTTEVEFVRLSEAVNYKCCLPKFPV